MLKLKYNNIAGIGVNILNDAIIIIGFSLKLKIL